MKSYINAVAAAAFVAVGAPAFADTQVQASPGVTLTEAAQAKFNRDTRGDDRHVKPIAGTSEPSRQFYASAGLTIGEGRSMSVDQVHVAKINREARGDDKQLLVAGESVAMATRAYGQGGDYEPARRLGRPHRRRGLGHEPHRDRGGEVRARERRQLS